MTDNSKMSDFEINKSVAEITGDSRPKVEEWGISRTIPDYCNNPADAWPIIESKLICLAADVFAEPQDGGRWVAQPAYGWDTERVRSDNPLRAAMIVFLMMKEAEQCSS